MQSLLFLNSHFVCSDEGPYCPLGRPSHVRDGGKGGMLCEQESTDLEGGVTDIFICYLFPSFFFVWFQVKCLIRILKIFKSISHVTFNDLT